MGASLVKKSPAGQPHLVSGARPPALLRALLSHASPTQATWPKGNQENGSM